MRRIFAGRISAVALTLGAIEILMVTGLLCLGLSYFSEFGPHNFSNTIGPVSLAGAFSVFRLMQAGTPLERKNSRQFHRTESASWLVPVLVLAIAVPWMIARYNAAGGRYGIWQWAFLGAAAVLFVLLVIRFVLARLYENGYFVTHVFAVGDENQRAKLREIANEGSHNFSIAGELDVSESALLSRNAPASAEPGTCPVLEMARRHHASEIVILADGGTDLPWSDLLQCKLAGIPVTDYRRFCERECELIDLETLDPHWFVFGEGFYRSPVGLFMKRGFDVFVSIVGLAIVAPVMLATAFAIKMEDNGSMLYRQERVGLNGKPFTILKFRSMRTNAEEDGNPRWAGEADSRITGVGRIIRKFRVDELPQFFNVLRGDMSFIGPRPERPYFVERLAAEIPYFHQRHTIKPGITGWAQVNFRYGASIDDARRKLSYDLYYLKNQSRFLDFLILIRTVRVILWPSGVR